MSRPAVLQHPLTGAMPGAEQVHAMNPSQPTAASCDPGQPGPGHVGPGSPANQPSVNSNHPVPGQPTLAGPEPAQLSLEAPVPNPVSGLGQPMGDAPPAVKKKPSFEDLLAENPELTETKFERFTPEELEQEVNGLNALADIDDGMDQPEAVMRELSATSMSPRHQFEAWIAAMVKAGASDLILRAGGRPSTRVDGRISFLPGRVPGPGALIEILVGVIGRDRLAEWKRTGSVDAALYLDGLGRFRLNAYKQMGEPAFVLRHVAENPPDLTSLELPTAGLQQIARRKRGFVLVTGVAGSGKSTTLAGLIEHMNRSMERHIITLEDPVEMLFREKRCVISQREVGVDCSTFHEGLRHALRQSPDVILIGEMRDPETVTAALDAAETGHLVMSTMHTVNAPQTVDRILSFFRAEQHSQVRMRLADNLAAVLSQRLVPRSEGKGLVPACELMVSTPRIRELLMEGDTAEMGRVVEDAIEPGLISFNQSLRRLVQAKLVELKDGLAASDKPEELVLALRGITKGNDRSQHGRSAPPAGSSPGGSPPGPEASGGGPLRMSGKSGG